MKPVDQTIIDKNTGNCHQAIIASIFELELSQVPHFRLFPDEVWFRVYYYFLYAMGFEYSGEKRDLNKRPLLPEDSLNGFFDAAVQSETFGEGFFHAIVLDLEGTVVHDPNPNKLWQGRNVIEENSLKFWNIFDPVKK